MDNSNLTPELERLFDKIDKVADRCLQENLEKKADTEEQLDNLLASIDSITTAAGWKHMGIVTGSSTVRIGPAPNITISNNSYRGSLTLQDLTNRMSQIYAHQAFADNT